LSEELEQGGVRQAIISVHARFLPLNAQFQDAVTRWQIRPSPGQPMATNDHTDHRWDDRVIESLQSVGRKLGPLGHELAGMLERFSGYAERYTAAAERVGRGERLWVDGLGIDSCHTVWMQLHEDLLATLGLDRSQER
jgi:hypothetical protein